MPADLPTPHVTVDADVLERNLTAMAARAADHGLALRPHAKTHKCVEIAHRQVGLGAGGLTVATVSEAEVFADGGLDDLFIAYPIWPSPQRAARLRALAARVALRVGVDSAEAAEALGRAVPGLEVLIEVDSGHHRSGVDPRSAGRVAVAADQAGLRVRGVFTFPGHAYGPGRQQPAAADEATALAEAAAAVTGKGLDAGVRSGGSTPTVPFSGGDPLTEMRPGVYVFGDAQQLELGGCAWDEVALTVASTVVSRSGPKIVLDAGSKVLGADRQSWATGFGRLLDHPDARVTALSEHHATAILPDGVPTPALGEVLRVVPNHVCATVNLADDLVVVSGGDQVDRWPVAARGANT
ncbi:alanine racemase [Actinoplanes oblitus]|uniref:Alanine racemase n=1 Tax=Actinoplanes oblitus TaxID=3040509 RepID=A0ABY8WNX4_9ACTN|nr:alanine racemase [Actinoplanes oblitus]WIM99338.1 alanine racemase [Actinoplanes oblitus]